MATKRDRAISLRALLALLLAAALLPIITLQVLVYQHGFAMRRDAAVAANLEIAEGVATVFTAFVRDVGREEKALAAALAASGTFEGAVAASTFLSEAAGDYPSLRCLMWMAPDGVVKASSDPTEVGLTLALHPFFARALATPHWVVSDVLPARPGEEISFVIARAYRDDSGRLAGVMAAEVDPQALASGTLALGHPGSRAVMLADSQGRLACVHPFPESPLDTLAATATMHGPLLTRALAGTSASGVVPSPFADEEAMVAWVPVAGTDWVAGASAPVSVVLAPVRDAMVVVVVLNLLVLAVSMAVAFVIKRRVSRGMAGLHEHVLALNAGELDHQADDRGVAEIAALGRSFDLLAAERSAMESAVRDSTRRLRDINETLEHRVAERTAEAEQRAGQLRELAARLVHAEHHERRRIAAVLHDHLQQLIVGARFTAGSLRRKLTEQAALADADKLDELLRESLDATRSLAVELSPPVLHQAGLPSALEWLIKWMEEKHGLRIDCELERDADPADEETRVLLFSAVRELLLNVVKHADVDEAELQLNRVDETWLEVLVADRGPGMDLSRRRVVAGMGLASIRERLELMGGHFELDSAPGRGTRVRIRAPLRRTSTSMP